MNFRIHDLLEMLLQLHGKQINVSLEFYTGYDVDGLRVDLWHFGYNNGNIVAIEHKNNIDAVEAYLKELIECTSQIT